MSEVLPETIVEDSVTNKKRMRISALVLAVLLIIVASVWALNYFRVNRPLQNILRNDPRNHVVKASAHWNKWVDPNELFFDIDGITGDASRADVFRVLLQFAETLKDHRFSRVILASHGDARFTIDGAYFQELGIEYATQNPMYTIRTFPTRVTTMDGEHPFHEYEGNLLGVLQAEMQQFSEFSDEWYLNDSRNRIQSSDKDSESSKTPRDPCEGIRDRDPHCGWTAHWDSSNVSVNEIDGNKTQFLMLESTDPDGEDAGDLHYAKLRLCFRNGKLCSGNSVSVGVKVHGMVDSLGYDSEYSTRVRMRFDDGSPAKAIWGISDDHEMFFPSGHEKKFADQLLTHKKLVIEFSYYEKAPRTLTFDLGGLAEAMQSNGLSL